MPEAKMTCRNCGCLLVPIGNNEWAVTGTGTTADGLSYCPPNPDAVKVGKHRPRKNGQS
jgi:hypothetical protein